MTQFIQNLDIQILLFIQNNLRNSLMDKLMPFLTILGESGLIWIVICIGLIFSKKYRRFGIMGICAFLLSALLSEYTIKFLVHRPRPFVIYPHDLIIPKPKGYSFPSSHTTWSFAVATILCIPFKKYGIIFFILASLIAFSRLYLFVHNPSDVLAGIILGLICAFIIICAFKIESKFNGNKT